MNELLEQMMGEFEDIPKDSAYELPTIRRNTLDVASVIGFNYVLSQGENHRDKIIHFFLDDHEFERVWNKPFQYTEIVARHTGAFSPDFSVYRNLPMAVSIWNTFRNRYCGYLWQRSGIKVISSISWSSARSFDFCFKGVEKGSDVAISTRGVVRDTEAMELFPAGYREMIRQIEPMTVYVFGAETRFKKRYPEFFELSEIRFLKDEVAGALHF